MSTGEAIEVSILIVTHNEADDLPACFEHVADQTHRPLSVVVVDCASTDDSLQVARSTQLDGIPITVVDAGANLGFAGGMNEAFRHTAAPFVLTLNADAHLTPSFVATLLDRALDPAERVGAVYGAAAALSRTARRAAHRCLRHAPALPAGAISIGVRASSTAASTTHPKRSLVPPAPRHSLPGVLSTTYAFP